MGLWGKHKAMNIMDPYGRSAVTYKKCFDLIDIALGSVMKRMNH